MKKSRNSFKLQIRRAFLLYALAMISLLIILFAAGNFGYLRVYIARRNRTENLAVSQKINEQLNAYRQTLLSLRTDDECVSFLKGEAAGRQAYEKLYAFENGMEFRSVFYLLNREGRIRATNAYRGDSVYEGDTFLAGSIGKKLQKMPEQPAEDVHFAEHRSGQESVYVLAAAVMDGEDTVGYLAFDILENGLIDLLSTHEDITFVLTDPYGYSVYASDPLLIDKFGKFFAPDTDQYTSASGTVYQMVSSELDGGLKLHTLISMELQNRIVSFGLLVIGIVFLLIIPVSSLSASHLAHRMSQSVSVLSSGIADFRDGKLDTRIGLSTGDEFEMLARSFNTMADEIQQLLADNRALSDIQRITEIRQLEAQFNPHFLFNVIENIRCMVLMGEDTENINQAFLSVTRLLRYSIDHSCQFVQLEQDLIYLELYLSLQKLRFRERLQYEIRFDEEALECSIPKLLLQPLVDNCIKHNFHQKPSLKIRISGECTDGKLYLCIEDDGDGITPERLGQVCTEMNADTPQTSDIGLFSAQRRIRLAYGTQYGLTLESREGIGTVVRATLPVIVETGE